MKKDKVLIVDDDESMCDVLEAILKEEYFVLKAQSGKEALKKLSNHDISVVLLDIRLPGISGIDTLEKIVARYPYIKCLMLSALQDVDTIVESIKKGAHDYMTKELQYEAVHLRVRNAMAQAKLKKAHDQQIQKIMLLEGQLKKMSLHNHSLQRSKLFGSKREDVHNLLCDSSLKAVFRKVGDTNLSHFISPCLKGEYLTGQEQKILGLILKGLANREIAHELNIKLPTVKTHLKNTFQKLGVTSRSQAVTYLLLKRLRNIPSTT